MLKRFTNFIYYLWTGETKEQHDKRQAEQAAREAELEAQRKASEARRKAEEAKWEAAEKARVAERKAFELAYQKFLETNEVTRTDAPVLDDDAIREQRRKAMRFAKEMQDGMSD